MSSYNTTLELTGRYSDELATDLLDQLADYHPAASRSEHGHPEVVLTIQAETVRQAASTAIAVVQSAGHEVYTLEVMPTDEFDRRLGLEPVPELLSVTEAATALGVSRQAVQQRIDAGSLPAQRVGSTWVLPATGLLALGERVVRQAVDAGVLNPEESPFERTTRDVRTFLEERNKKQAPKES